MMDCYDLYEVRAPSLLDARREVERVLGVVFGEHESGYHGGRYYRHGADDAEHLVLQVNFDSFEQELFEPDFSGVKLLLYVNNTRRPEELRAMLEGDGVAKRLRTEGLE